MFNKNKIVLVPGTDDFPTLQCLSSCQTVNAALLSLHLFSSNCCTNFLPTPHDDECWYPNPETVCKNEICPKVERTDPEVEAIQVCSDEINHASVELAQADGNLENMAVRLAGCNGIAASGKLVVRQNKSNPNCSATQKDYSLISNLYEIT
jgi:hypothetical protein